MAARVGSPATVSDDAGGSTTHVTSTKSTTTGNCLIAIVKWEHPSAPANLSTVTDTAGNSWVIIGQVNYGGTGEPIIAMAYAANITGNASNAVTFTFSNGNTNYTRGIVEEFSGLATSSVLDGSAQTNTGTTADYSTSNITTSQAGLVVLGTGDFASLSNFTGTPGTPDFSVGGTLSDTAFFYYISGSGQTITPGAGADGNTQWVAIAQAFKDSSGGSNTNYNPGAGSAAFTGRTLLVNPQTSRPSADATDGNWTPSTGADLYAVLDEAARDDGDYIQSANNPSNDACTVKLATIALPGTNEGFQLQWSAGALGATGSVTASLRQGNSPGTEIASWTHGNLPVGSFQEFGDAVTPAQAANITDGADLYLRIVAN